jgi:DNA-binding transcriptional ArsR family regulator
MDTTESVARLSALAHPTRLEVFRHLVGAEPHGLPAGEVARRLGVPHNTLSSHLAILTRAGLTSVERHSRSMIYRAQLKGVHELVLYLLRDCCNGKPELCAPLVTEIFNCCSDKGATCG